jgi:hypothetical protein
MIKMRFTVRERMLAIVQKAGMNLKRGSLLCGAGDEAVGMGGGETSVRGVDGFEPFPVGSLERMESSMSPEINFFILLLSFWLESGVVIQPPRCGSERWMSQISS